MNNRTEDGEDLRSGLSRDHRYAASPAAGARAGVNGQIRGLGTTC